MGCGGSFLLVSRARKETGFAREKERVKGGRRSTTGPPQGFPIRKKGKEE